jgi:hypothetical protein
MNIGMCTKPPETISAAYIINHSHQKYHHRSLCYCCHIRYSVCEEGNVGKQLCPEFLVRQLFSKSNLKYLGLFSIDKLGYRLLCKTAVLSFIWINIISSVLTNFIYIYEEI